MFFIFLHPIENLNLHCATKSSCRNYTNSATVACVDIKKNVQNMRKRPKFTQPPPLLKKKLVIFRKLRTHPSPFLEKNTIHFLKEFFYSTLITHFTIIRTYLNHIVFKHVRLCGINLCNGWKDRIHTIITAMQISMIQHYPSPP